MDNQIFVQLRETDILLGRGGSTYGRTGNVILRDLIHENIDIYSHTPRSEKRRLARSYVDIIEGRGARFVEATPCGRYYLLVNEERKKEEIVMQLFRTRLLQRRRNEEEVNQLDEQGENIVSSVQAFGLHILSMPGAAPSAAESAAERRSAAGGSSFQHQPQVLMNPSRGLTMTTYSFASFNAPHLWMCKESEDFFLGDLGTNQHIPDCTSSGDFSFFSLMMSNQSSSSF